ncbi:SAM-dependent methyltransferase [Streptomyces sp. TLI_146]|uniref:SAM-dependent methyltransferase n=1 Tax=Streptomyces sp. TLI_146 TaxID=1938858 RepID=UPI000C701728|nr:SAM-dependent methyltransferase [Streptomyces sp. TLI_146]PKV84223.1 S-adenosyl methyltransferase [Streptomyces sp. TLI_146]
MLTSGPSWRGPGAPALDDDAYRRPNPARVYHLLSGGRDSFQLDRDFAQRLFDADNTIVSASYINRDHSALTARFFAELDFQQVLDLGCGYAYDWSKRHQRHEPPTLREVLPGASIVHVDIDPIVVGLAQSTMRCVHGNPSVLQADIQYMAEILAHPQVAPRFDLDRPIAVLLHDVLPWIADDQAVTSALAVLREWLPPGSVLSITHASADLALMPNAKAKLTALWAEEAAVAFRPRSRNAIQVLFGGWPLLDPGLVPTHRWHPEHPDTRAPEAHSGAYAGIARKPHLSIVKDPPCTS